MTGALPAYETYPRGHGLIGRRALSSNETIIIAPAIVEDGVKLWGSPTISGDSRIRSGTLIFGSPQIHNTHTFGPQVVIADRVIVNRSILAVDCTLADDAYLDGCDLRGIIEIGERAILEGCSARGHVIVRGTAILKGFAIPDGARIDEGHWSRPPLVVRTSGFTMTEASNGRVRIGCRALTPKTWLRRGEQYGRVYGMTEAEIDAYRAAISVFL